MSQIFPPKRRTTHNIILRCFDSCSCWVATFSTPARPCFWQAWAFRLADPYGWSIPTVDAGEILHQLKTMGFIMVYPIIHRVQTIQGGAGFRNHPQYGWNYGWIETSLKPREKLGSCQTKSCAVDQVGDPPGGVYVALVVHQSSKI